MWTSLDVCKSLSFRLDNIYVRFGDAVYRQVIGIPMGINCAPLVAYLFLYCCERDFMLSLKSDTQSDTIEAFNNTSRYLDDIFNIDNPFFDTLFHFTRVVPKCRIIVKSQTIRKEKRNKRYVIIKCTVLGII